MSFKVLCLDGGGVFGRVQSRILTEADCFNKFDAFVGTSIGAVQALAISVGKSSVVRPSYFDRWMPIVFKTSFLRRINLLQSEYPDTGLNEALKDVFGSNTLGNAKKPVFVTAADIGRKTLKVFSSTNFEDASWPMWEVARAATAAETYFPPWKGFADGGIYANNPSMVGLAAAIRVLGVKMEDLEILSIGTGEYTGTGNTPSNRLSWAVWLVRAMLSGSADKMHDYFVRSLPVKKYVRIQFVCANDRKMDDPRSMYLAERDWALEIRDAIKKVKEF